MYCKNCGKTLNQGAMFCPNCGAKIESQSNTILDNNVNQNQEIGQNLNQTFLNNQGQTNNINSFDTSSQNYNLGQANNMNTFFNQNSNQMNNEHQANIKQQPDKPKNNKLIKILAIIGGIVVGLIILFIVIFAITSANSEKLVCKSSEGNITIMYNEKGIIGYTASGMGYDLDGQKEVAKKIGINNYIKEFNNWFTLNTSGSCTIDGKEL